MAGINENAFSWFFHKNTGGDFTDHIRKLRLGCARKLLADSNMAIADIRFDVGYSNISNFSRCRILPARLGTVGKLAATTTARDARGDRQRGLDLFRRL
jgi:AraC-like DNA-binding protein